MNEIFSEYWTDEGIKIAEKEFPKWNGLLKMDVKRPLIPVYLYSKKRGWRGSANTHENKIMLNEFLHDEKEYDKDMRSTLLHELIHIYLGLAGKPVGHNSLFKSLLYHSGTRDHYTRKGRWHKEYCAMKYGVKPKKEKQKIDFVAKRKSHAEDMLKLYERKIQRDKRLLNKWAKKVGYYNKIGVRNDGKSN